MVFANISAELLKGRGETLIRKLHAVLTSVWQSGTVLPDWKRGPSSLSGKGKGIVSTAATEVLHPSACHRRSLTIDVHVDSSAV